VAPGEQAHGELTDAEKQRVNAAVSAAELQTGLEFCVIVGSRPQSDARHEAERAFHKLRMHERPAIMIMVVPHARTLEVVTAPDVDGRLTDKHCDQAVSVMTAAFSTADIVSGLELGVQTLASFAGPRTDGQTGHHDGVDLPNIVDLDEDL